MQTGGYSMNESVFLFKTRDGSSPENKPKVYFTCHPDDYNLYFDMVCNDIFESQDCAIYYTADMTCELSDPNTHVDLERMHLFVIPITYKLLTTSNRALEFDFRFAQRKNISVLPLIMESGIGEIYRKPDKFGELQYIKPFDTDITSIGYKTKLKKFLESVLINDELADRIRNAFDAYIFLSYRKKDRKYANELMKLIHKNPECEDIAIWFDEFLTPGESFRKNIEKILSDSKLFALLVTPSLLERHADGSPNFIMREEYPAAKKQGKRILPAEMVNTNKEELKKEFEDIPECANPNDEDSFNTLLLNSLVGIAISENNDVPEHNYLIGLAYLKGIDVEIDVERGVRLVTKAADTGLSEAMIMLHNMYKNGINVSRDFNKALEWIKKLYEQYKGEKGEKNPDTIWALNVLADTYYLKGDYRKSIECYENDYNLCLEIFGDDSIDALDALNGLAIAYSASGDIIKGIELSEKCYEMRKRVLGETHSDTLISLSNLAMAYGDISQLDKMIELSEKCYELMRDTFGEENAYTLTTLNNLAVAYLNLGNIYGLLDKKQKALELCIKCFNTKLKLLGPDHPNTLDSLGVLASAFAGVSNFQKCIELANSCYYAKCNTYGEDHPNTLIVLRTLADTYGKIGNKEKNLELSEKCFNLFNKVLGPDHPSTLESMNSLADAYGRSGMRFKRIKISKQSYNTCKRVLGENHQTTLDALYQLAAAYAKVGRFVTSGWLHMKGMSNAMEGVIRNRRANLL